jgi:RNA methyltransferase, TrmH family
VPPAITSPSNDRIKWLVRLRERRHRDAEGVFVVEGERLYRRAISAGLVPDVVFTDGTVDVDGHVTPVDPSVLDKASYRSRSEGIIAVFPQFDVGIGRIEPSPTPLLLVVEDVEKPGNLGAMMRTAAAAGADAVITVGATVDPFNPNALRSSTGALFSVPLAVSSWEETAPWLEGRGVEVVGASPDGENTLWAADLTRAVAVVIGAEDRGLSEVARSIAGTLVSIPHSYAGVDSLNASVAAAVVLFETVRQRTVG